MIFKLGKKTCLGWLGQKTMTLILIFHTLTHESIQIRQPLPITIYDQLKYNLYKGAWDPKFFFSRPGGQTYLPAPGPGFLGWCPLAEIVQYMKLLMSRF